MSVSYQKAKISDLKVVTETTTSASGQPSASRSVIINDQDKVSTSARFWTSIQRRLGIAPSIFQLFSHEEVFDRASSIHKDREFTLTIDNSDGESPKLLGLSADDAIRLEDAQRILTSRGGEKVSYSDGVVSATFTPRSGQRAFEIGGDEFKNRYSVKVPIDGLGDPQAFLSLLRLVCSNGMVAMAPAFRSVIAVGSQGGAYSVDRFLQSYDNVRGFDILQSRMDQATQSWASIREAHGLATALSRANAPLQTISSLSALAGNPAVLYGVATIDSMAPRRQAMLPSKATVYDLINFATEYTTHHSNDANAQRIIHAYVGTLLSGEYDLEGTKSAGMNEFADFFLKDTTA